MLAPTRSVECLSTAKVVCLDHYAVVVRGAASDYAHTR